MMIILLSEMVMIAKMKRFVILMAKMMRMFRILRKRVLVVVLIVTMIMTGSLMAF